MLIPDVNVLLNAYFVEQGHHVVARRWLETVRAGNERLGISDIVLNGFIRISTSRAFARPLQLEFAFETCDVLRSSRIFLSLASDDRQWRTYRDLAIRHASKPGEFTDAYLAALAVSHNATLVTFDRGFQRFEGLKLFEPG